MFFMKGSTENYYFLTSKNKNSRGRRETIISCKIFRGEVRVMLNIYDGVFYRNS